MDDKLLSYLDGTLNAADTKELEGLLQQDEKLRERLDWLRRSEALFGREIPAEDPSANFTAAVMSRLSGLPVQRGFSSRNGVALLAGIMLIVLMASLLVYAGLFDGTASFDLDTVLFDRYFKDAFPAITLSEKTIVNAIIFLNTALALRVLDKTVLRPWFQQRAERNARKHDLHQVY